MRVSLNWLNEFVDLSGIDEKQIAHELTMSGLEVEAIFFFGHRLLRKFSFFDAFFFN